MQKFFHFSNFSLLIFHNFHQFHSSPTALLETSMNSEKTLGRKVLNSEAQTRHPNRNRMLRCWLYWCIGGEEKALLGINANENISQWKCATIRAFSSFLAICHDNDLIHEWYLMSCFAPFLPLRFIHMCIHKYTHTLLDIIYFISLACPVEWIFLMDISVVK